MSGKRAKVLRRAVRDTFNTKDVGGNSWRKVKRAWNDTPAPDRGDFEVREALTS